MNYHLTYKHLQGMKVSSSPTSSLYFFILCCLALNSALPGTFASFIEILLIPPFDPGIGQVTVVSKYFLLPLGSFIVISVRLELCN